MRTSTQLLSDFNLYLSSLPLACEPRGLYDPIAYVLSSGGKRLRPILMMMAYNLYKEDVENIYSQAAAIEIYHNYTLLHDDLMDRADMRRGNVTVHKKWNDNTAILSGDAMLVLAYKYMMQCPAEHLQDVLGTFSQTALEICEGQQLDMDFESRSTVSESEYIEMIRLKTSVLLAASLKIGALMANAPAQDVNALYQLGINLGLAFQLKDDLLDVYGTPETFGKNIGGDILCNKKTYLLVKAMEYADTRQLQELKSLFSLATSYHNSQEKIDAVTKLYNEIGIREICDEKIKDYSAMAEAELTKLSIASERKRELEGLVANLISRTY